MSSSDSETEDFCSSDDSFVIPDHIEDSGDSEVEKRVPNRVSIYRYRFDREM